MSRFLIVLLFGLPIFSQAYEAQKKPGFVGYIPAGSKIQIRTVNENARTVHLSIPSAEGSDIFVATFNNFERALGDNRKVEYVNKVEPLAGREVSLKHNLLILTLK